MRFFSKKSKEKKKEIPESMEGQLAIDVYQTDSEIIVQAQVAGIRAKDLDIFIEDNTVTIEGIREGLEEESEEKECLRQECYWGPFSRQIILPEEVNSLQTKALLKKGVLILKIPKIRESERRKIEIKEILDISEDFIKKEDKDIPPQLKQIEEIVAATKICQNCGKPFKVSPSRYEKAKYCSIECMAQAFRGKRLNKKPKSVLQID